MLKVIKYKLYFVLASYFRFFARIQLSKWNPRVVVVTGSSGKTTLLHLIESQLGEKARYSHFANSSFGIPFDILGLKRKSFSILEWPWLFLVAPFRAFKKPFAENIYIVEADCDRPDEGEFLASLLHPEVVLWVSLSRTHTANFDQVVTEEQFLNVEQAIAYEFGYFLAWCTSLAVVNGDNQFIVAQLKRTKVEVKQIHDRELHEYGVSKEGTTFGIGQQTFRFNFLLPREVFYSISSCLALLEYLHISPDVSFKNFSLPSGRAGIFQGKKDTTLIDSSYNANLDSMSAILNMYKDYPGSQKWVVLGDMTEQGNKEQEEHERLGELLRTLTFSRIILVGPRLALHTYPKLAGLTAEKFNMPKDALEYLKLNIQGGETILFKGARFLEGIVEHLLENPEDIKKLPRREKVWQDRRKAWGL